MVQLRANQRPSSSGPTRSAKTKNRSMPVNTKSKRKQQNNPEEAGEGFTETILRKVGSLYEDQGCLLEMGKGLDIKMRCPSKKIMVMVMGNYSSGKSTFINWYTGVEGLLKTSAAVCTKGFTFVTQGVKDHRDPLKGDATLMMYPHLHPMKEKFGDNLVKNIQTVVSISQEKEFGLIDFVDSPGLIEGDGQDNAYPFDVNGALDYMGEHVDMILVFLDPHGQAHDKRVMEVVKQLNTEHYDKMKYYLTKVDTVPEADRPKLLVQITQDLTKNIKNTHGFEIPCLSGLHRIGARSEESSAEAGRGSNDVGKLCNDLRTTIHQKVQDNLNLVETDCKRVLATIKDMYAKDEVDRAARSSNSCWSWALFGLAWLAPLFGLLLGLSRVLVLLPDELAKEPVVIQAYEALTPVFKVVEAMAPDESVVAAKLAGGMLLAFMLLVAVSNFFGRRAARFSPLAKSRVKQLKTFEGGVSKLMERRAALYKEYFEHFIMAEEGSK